MPFTEVTLVLFAAAASAALGLWWLSRSTGSAPSAAPQNQAVAYLFEDELLHHASDAALELGLFAAGEDDWPGFRARFEARFPGLPDRADAISQTPVTFFAQDGACPRVLELSRSDRFARAVFTEGPGLQDNEFIALKHELEQLRLASSTTPHPVWQLNGKGQVVWHNPAYAALYLRLRKSPARADKPLFAPFVDRPIPGATRRVSIDRAQNGDAEWYDVRAVEAGDVTVFHAVDINPVVKAEVAQRNFVQTLGKTFAQLSTGLAIFDRDRQLVLFNPALIDLTDLPVDFLSARPTLFSFFDRMRDNRRMPEPKDYSTWRQEIAALVEAASDGRFQETWSLESGQTFRVKGRPHPDGAIAFLIEDVSVEMSLTRNFRAEVKLGHALMDSLEDAIAVFSSGGVLAFCNDAYRQMWGVDPQSSFADVTIADSVHAWQRLCTTGPDWPKVENFVMNIGPRASWTMPASRHKGGPLVCHVHPLASVATVVRFQTPAVKEARQDAYQAVGD